ncbi:hypothetical protein [Psychroserpens sp. NJDZ02]|uniref:hypothetical protein n=1 Tax=Psychroserpens sp. NJDZ02 TaxID=2570561 RepID=UPI0010A80FAD|nr:hypothetical protein [Psychroserpens sp. NJDZ02]QCE41892.1 hypothetical protein E9099_10875 [Psychroserpens sp. NJDZ02]
MKINKYLLLSFTLALTLFVSCSDDDDTTSGLNHVSFEISKDFLVEPGASSSRDIKLYSTNTEDSDRTYNVLVDMDATTADASAYSVPATVTIPAGSNVANLNVTVSDINIGGAGKVLTLMLEQDGSFFYGNDMVLNIKLICYSNEAALAIDFDSYSEESSWEILDASNAVVASSGGAYAAGTDTANEAVCLEDGTYTFVFTDSYGDGLDGTVTLSYDGTTLVDIQGFTGPSTGPISSSQTFTIGN